MANKALSPAVNDPTTAIQVLDQIGEVLILIGRTELEERTKPTSANTPAAVTRRERDVVTAVCAGLDTNTITQQLLISRHTVQDHLKSIFEKIGVHSRRELLATFNAAPHTGPTLQVPLRRVVATARQ